MIEDGTLPGRLVLLGQLTMHTADAIRDDLLQALDRHTTISIDCSDVEEVDLSFIQLLIAARGGGNQPRDNVVLSARPEGPLLRTLNRAGFHAVDPGGTGTGFWFATENEKHAIP
jgi:ABC-type transporter Mla MlaB component